MDLKSLIIEPLKLKHIDDALSFLKKYYGENYYGADNKYFRWLYVDCPCDWFSGRAKLGYIPANGIFSSSRQLIALHLYLPFDAIFNDESLIGVFDEEWINGTSIPGVGRFLAQHLVESTDVYIGFGCNDFSKTAFLKLGFHIIENVSRLVAIINREDLINLMLSIGGSDDCIPDEVDTNASWFEIQEIDKILTLGIMSRNSSYPNGSSRTENWFNWRYQNHPFIKYRYIAADQQGIFGFAVIRLEEVANTGFTNVRVVDLFCSENAEAMVFASLVKFAKDHNCLIIDYSTTSSSAACRLKKSIQDNFGIVLNMNPVVPYLFQPMALNNSSNFNAAVLSGANAKGFSIQDFHVTKADSTQDILRLENSGPILKKL